MNITAWIIALNPDNPVALELQSTLRAQGIDASIRQAVDGRQQMPVLQGDERLSPHQTLLYRQAPLTSAELGCYLSHFRLIREAYDAGLSHLCLFEDDVVAEPGIGDLLRDIVTLDDDTHLVRLMSLKIHKRKVIRPMVGGYTLVRPLRGALGTQGYVVNRTGMKKILDFGATIYLPIDKLYDAFYLYDLKCFSVEPHAVYEITRPTSVKKARKLETPGLSIRLMSALNKLGRSIRRRQYYFMHRNEFFPAQKPTHTVGKTKRIKT